MQFSSVRFFWRVILIATISGMVPLAFTSLIKAEKAKEGLLVGWLRFLPHLISEHYRDSIHDLPLWSISGYVLAMLGYALCTYLVVRRSGSLWKGLLMTGASMVVIILEHGPFILLGGLWGRLVSGRSEEHT